ncbi:MAG TPA: DUF1501 domain-containing protein, partial [Phycisphaerae bacterium]|nr:DUF1501 domain-containing protein [Phycisphaerae bacterium]
DVGVEAVAIDIPGWDTHNYQGVLPGGALWDLLTTLGDGLAAFHADMFSGNGKNVIVMVMSEFGRRLLENGSFGTDHGHGNCMFIMGKHVNGGRVLTQWPGLADDQLFQGRDLAVTIDFRDLMAEVVFNRLKNPNLATVFPGYTPTFRGVTLGCPGDLNCDSVVDGSDVAPFVNAVLDPTAFGNNPPACGSSPDMNGDGRIDGLDIQEFLRSVLP